MSDLETTAIMAVLGDYFDGWHDGDVDKLASVFHPSCRLQCVIEGEHDIDDMRKVYRGVATRPSPASRDEVRHDRVVSLSVAGPTWAAAQVELSIGPKLFTDYLSLLKLEGRWQIVSKVFGFRPSPASSS